MAKTPITPVVKRKITLTSIAVGAGGLLAAAASVVTILQWWTSAGPSTPPIVVNVPTPIPLPTGTAVTAEVAKARIKAEKFDLDNAGYIKAVAQGSEVRELFKDLGIRGDEASLRKALLSRSTEELHSCI